MFVCFCYFTILQICQRTIYCMSLNYELFIHCWEGQSYSTIVFLKIDMLWSNLQFVVYELLMFQQTICWDHLWKIMVAWHFTKKTTTKNNKKRLPIAMQCANSERMRNGFDYYKHVAAWTCTPAHTHKHRHTVPLRITPVGMPEALPTGKRTRVRQTESIASSCFQHSNILIILMLPALPKLMQSGEITFTIPKNKIHIQLFLEKG